MDRIKSLRGKATHSDQISLVRPSRRIQREKGRQKGRQSPGPPATCLGETEGDETKRMAKLEGAGKASVASLNICRYVADVSSVCIA